jgi:capsular exopolysaccharide synthesis family protein
MKMDTGGRTIEQILAAAPGAGDNAPADLGLMRLVNMFRRRLWVVALVTALVFMVVAFKTATAPRLYTASSQVEIDMRETRILNVESVLSGLPPNAAVVDTETQILQSRTLAGRVVDTLHLIDDPEFVPPPKPSWKDQLKELIRGKPPAKSALQLAQERANAREVAISVLLGRLRVYRVGMTYIIKIDVTSLDPKKAGVLADKFAELYLTQQLETKYDAIARANEWLSNRLEALRQEVQTKERAVENYRAQNGLLTASGSTLTEQAISGANLQLVQQRAELAEKEARLRSVEQDVAAGGARAESIAEALASPAIAALRAQQADIARQAADLRTKYGPKHPDILKNRQQAADVDKLIDTEIGRVVQSMRNEVQVARRRVASIEESLGMQRSDLAANNVGAVKLRELERDAEASSALYNAFLNRFKQVAEQSGIETPDARIVSRATAGWLSSPNTKLNLMMGLIMGLALGAVAAVILEILEQSLRSAQDVQDRLNVPCFGSIPFLDRKTRLVDGELVPPESFVLKRPLSAFGEALRSIRASVFFSSPDRKVKVLAVTSAVPEEGKTTTAVGLARISSLAGSKTVLVDCDLRRRSTTHSMGIECDRGLTEVLFKTATIDDVIVKDAGSGCDVIPLAQPEFTPRDLFSSEAMRQLVETLRSRYEVVILDTAPIMPLADTRVLAPLADTVLFVTRWGRTPASIVRNAMDQLRAHGANIAGVVLEGVETSMVSRLLYDGPDQYSELYQTYYIR